MKAETYVILESLADGIGFTQDFHRHAVAKAAAEKSDPSNYDIFWVCGQHECDVLTPVKWIQLLSHDKVDKGIFFLSPKSRASSGTPERDTNLYERGDRHEQVDILGGKHRKEPFGRSYTRYQTRETSYLSQESRHSLNNGPVSSATIESDSDWGSVSGRSDQGSVKINSSKKTRSERKSTCESDNGIACQRPPPLDEPILGYGQPERSNNQQVATEAPSKIQEIATRRESPNSIERDEEEALTKFPATNPLPFFSWRIKHDIGQQDEVHSSQQRGETAAQILNYIRESITLEQIFRGVYDNAHKCTADQLISRHPEIAMEMRADGYPEDDSSNGRTKPGNKCPTSPRKDHNSKEWQHAHETHGKTETNHWHSHGENLPQGLKSNQHNSQTGEAREGRLAEDSTNAKNDQTTSSTSATTAFPIGLEESAFRFETNIPANNKSRTVHFVGKPDQGLELKRQLLEVSQSIFRAFLPPQDASPHRYFHPLCECFWGSLDVMFRVSFSDPQKVITLQAHQLVEYLRKVSKILDEIQWLVESTAKGVPNQSPRPQLPRSLVQAFEALLLYYMFTAGKLSILNRSSIVNTERAKRKCRDLSQNVLGLLDNAKKQILLKGTQSEEEDALGIRAVGAEFVVMALVKTLQNRSVNLGQGNTSQITTQSSVGFIDMYQKYSNQIHFEANRRPQRRVFLAIHELEEELKALVLVLKSQRRLLSWYSGMIKPQKFDFSYRLRHLPYLFEKKYIEKQRHRLFLRRKEITRMQVKAAALKPFVTQLIEILDEDHGKAIRVFTIVTLFFLPLCVQSIPFSLSRKRQKWAINKDIG